MHEQSSQPQDWVALAMERYLTMVYRLAYARMGSKQDAEDTAQEVMLKLVENARRIRSEEHLKAWLIRVTVNQSNSLFRRARRRRTEPLWEERAAQVSPSRGESLELDEALNALSPKLRTTIHLRYYEDMTVEDIAKALSIRPDAVKMRLSRARRILKQHLTQTGGKEHV